MNAKVLREVVIVLAVFAIVLLVWGVKTIYAPPGIDPVAKLTVYPGYVAAVGRSYVAVGKTSIQDGSESYGRHGLSIVKYDWDFTNDGSYDYREYSGWFVGPQDGDSWPDGKFDGITTHAYEIGDVGTQMAKLKVTDAGLIREGSTLFEVNVSEDTDGDDMPDAWELYYWPTEPLLPHSFDELYDSDIYNNLCEYLHSSDPTEGTETPDPDMTMTIYVPGDVSNIQRAIDAAIEGDTIVVAEGTYNISAPLDFKDKAIRVTCTDPNDPAIVESTIIDGNDVLKHVVEFTRGEGADSVLEGFTITGGNANGSSGDACGGGIYFISNSSPTISKCVIRDNSAADDGGGIYCDGASPTINKCKIVGNESGTESGDNGGGIYCNNASPTIKNCVIKGNTAGDGGGGMYNTGSDPTVISCAFVENGSSDGAGIYNSSASNPDIINCVFTGNQAEATSGYSEGGGIANFSASSPEVINCTFSRNTAEYGGGMYNDNDSSITPTVTNCIFWDNYADMGADEICNWGDANPVVSFCDIKGGYEGGTNIIDVDPRFVDAVNPAGEDGVFLTFDDGLRIGAYCSGSCCVDGGDDMAIRNKGVTEDILGNERIVDGDRSGGATVDIGAYELPLVWYVNDDVSSGNGESWDTAYDDLQDAIAAASEGDEIWVAEGAYKPTDTTERNISFVLKSGVGIYGGFAGNEVSRKWRDWKAYKTILSGDIDGMGDQDSYQVVTGADDGILDGFTITGGGNGIYCDEVSFVRISNCVITGNTAGGAGMECNESTAILTNCVFNDNIGTYTMYTNRCSFQHTLEHGYPRLINCVFAENQKNSYWDCEIRSEGSSPTLRNCTISGYSTAEATGDYIGGVAYDAKLYALKITEGGSGSSDTDTIVAAWNWCISHKNDDPDNPILVISTSFGGANYDSVCDTTDDYTIAYKQAADNAVAAGITVLASSGNDGYCDSLASPACVSSVISVGAVYDGDVGRHSGCISGDSCAGYALGCGCSPDSEKSYVDETTAADQVTTYSNSASFLDVLAPSTNAYTTDIVGAGEYAEGDYYGYFGGTSAACPYAAGAVACLQSAAKEINGDYLTPLEVRTYLTTTGQDITDNKSSIVKPRIDLAAAITELGGGEAAARGESGAVQTDVAEAIQREEELLACPPEEKFISHEDIMSGFAEGQERVRVIVNLARPLGLMAATDWNSKVSLDALQSEVLSRQQEVLSTLSGAEFKLRYRFENQAGFSGEATLEALEKLSRHPRVMSIEPVYTVEAHLAQGVRLINALGARAAYSGQGVSIAVCDTGVDYTHPRLGGGTFPNNKVIGGRDFGDDDSDPSPDGNPHGTACAGIAGGSYVTRNPGYGLYSSGSGEPKITNCIIWGYQYSIVGTEGYISCSDIEGCGGSGDTGGSWNWDPASDGGGNKDLYPVFSNPEVPAGEDGVWCTFDDGLRVETGSACVDSANGDAATVLDIIGLGRSDISGVGTGRGDPDYADMGAYESRTTTIWYVDIVEEGTEDGLSWENAFEYLQDALMKAMPGDEIRVAGYFSHRHYYPDGGTDLWMEDDERAATFLLPEFVTIKGGYGGDYYSSDPDERRIGEWSSILDGDIDGDRSLSNNSYHVVTGSRGAVLDGFIIMGGNADGSSYPEDSGAGIYSDHAWPTISRCVITGNDATNGAGMYGAGDSCLLVNSFFVCNQADKGGGVYAGQDSSLRLVNCVFTENDATDSSSDGGGIYSVDASPELINCTFYANTASSDGGGMYNESGAPTVVNSIFWANTDASGANQDESAQIHVEGGAVDVTYSCIEGLSVFLSGTGNIGDDVNEAPIFYIDGNCHDEPAGDDGYWGTYDDGLQLLDSWSETNKEMNSGSNAAIEMITDVDAKGDGRIRGAVVDMGAYEYHYERGEDSFCFAPGMTPKYIWASFSGIEACTCSSIVGTPPGTGIIKRRDYYDDWFAYISPHWMKYTLGSEDSKLDSWENTFFYFTDTISAPCKTGTFYNDCTSCCVTVGSSYTYGIDGTGGVYLCGAGIDELRYCNQNFVPLPGAGCPSATQGSACD